MKKVEVLTYGRNSDNAQKTSQAIQDDVFDVHLKEQWLQDLLHGQPVVVDEYRDHGKSASKKKSKRHDFFRMNNDIQGKHRGKPILVVNLSRLTRLHPNDALALFNTLRETRNNVVSLDDRKLYKTDTLMELLEVLIKSNDNYEYARTLAKNTLRGNLRATLEGRNHTRTVPYGMAKLVVFEDGTEKIFPEDTKLQQG